MGLLLWPNTTTPVSPTARQDNVAISYTAPRLRAFFRFKRFMDDFEAWAGCMSSLTQLVCTRAEYEEIAMGVISSVRTFKESEDSV
jgi:hypothetical protein